MTVSIGPPPVPNRKTYPFVGSCLFAGIPIDIEQRKGDVREGVDPDGHKWRVKMHAHYGEVRAKGWPGAKGMDGDQLDVYVGPDPASDVVVVIDQLVPATGKVDEQKVMLGFPTVKEAVACYKRQYDSPGFYGGHIVMTVDRFKQKIANKENAGSALAKALAVIFKSGGPYIGPRGGKWADPQHTIPWKPSQMSLPLTRPTQPEWHERLLAVDATGRMLVDGFTDMKVEVTPANVHAIESRLRGQNIETAVVIGGGRTFARRGTSDSVPFMEHERMELAAYGECVATHNHPHDAPLSPTDVALAINANISEMRAVTRHGVFWLRRPAGGWRHGDERRILVSIGQYLDMACDAATSIYRSKLGEARHHEVMQSGLSEAETAEFNQVFHQQGVQLLPKLQGDIGRDLVGFTPWADIEAAQLHKGGEDEGFEHWGKDRGGDASAAAGRGDSSGQGLAANLCTDEHARAGCRDRHSDGDGAIGEHRVVKADSPKSSISRVYSGIAYVKARRDVLAMRDGDVDATERLASHLADHPGLRGFSGIVAPIPRSTPERAQHHVFARALVAKGSGLSPEEHAASMRAIVEPADRDAPVLLVDDLFMGGGTIRGAALALREAGHRGLIIGATAAHASRQPPWSHVTIPVDGVWIAKAGGPYIGPHGGKWADPQHTVHWEPSTPHNFREREPLGVMTLRDGTRAILNRPYDGRDWLTSQNEDAVIFSARHEHDGRDLGYVNLIRRHGSGEWSVGNAHVAPAHRRNGLYSRLMDEASNWVRSRGESLYSGRLTTDDVRAFYAKKLSQGRVARVGGSYRWVDNRAQTDLIKGGPYIGPRGGKWADPQHTIHWEDRNQRQLSLPTLSGHHHERPVEPDEHKEKLDRIMDYGAACAAHVEWSKRLKVAHEALKAWDDDFANRPVRDTAMMAERLREITDTLAAGHVPHGEVIRGVMFESVASATGTFALEQAELILRMRRSLIKDFEGAKPGFRSFLKKLHREMVSNNFSGMIVNDIQHSGLVGVVGLRNDSHQFVIDEHVPAYMRKNAEGWAKLRDGLEAELSAWLRLPQEHHALAAKAGLRVSPVLTPGGHSLISGDANTGRHGPPVIRLFNAERHGEKERPHSVLCHEFGHIVEGVVNNARDEKVPPDAPDYFVRDETGNYRKKVWGLSEVFRKHCTPSRERRRYWDEGWGNRSVEWFAEAYRYAYGELHGTPEGMITNLDEEGFDRARFRAWVDAHVARALRGNASLDNEFTPNLAKGAMLKAAVGHGTIHRWADGKLHRKTQHGWEPVPEPSAMVGEHFKAGRDEYAIAEVDGDRVRVVPEHGGSGQWIPKASLRHFHDDLNGIVRSGHPETAPHPAIKGVLEGKGKYLGKGDDGVVFQHGDKVVKVSTTVPFQPMNPGHLTPKAAANRLEHQANVSEHLRKLGVPGLIEVKSFRHGDKSYQVRDHVEIPERLTKEQLDSAADTVHAIHKLGWALNDDVQVGVHDGKTVMYDTGKAAPARVGHLKWDSDQARDKERLARLYREHGLAYHDPGKPSVKDAMAKFKEALGGDDEGAMLDAHSAYLDAINHNPILARKADDELWAAFEEQDKRKLSKADGQRTIAALLTLLPGLFKAGGPYIGPRGGKWANAAHTIAWSERGGHRPNHRRGHDKLTPSHQKARARLAKHELRIRDSHVEHVIVAEGKGPLHIQEGEASHALMRRDDVERWSRRGDAVLTHNHPSGMCFSESDMRTAYHANLAEIRAVTSSGVWSFVRPSDGWERPYHFIAQNNDRLVVQPAQRAMQSHVRDHGFDQEVWLDQLVHATHTKLHPALIEEFGDDVSYTRWPDRPGKKRVRRVEKAKGGPYIGPRGGKWADPQHTIPWKPSSSAIRRTAGTVSGHGSEHEPLNWSASGIVVGELHPGRASLGDLAKAILEGDNDPERAELTYQWLRDSWPKLQKVRTSEELFSALDGYDDHVTAVLREREEARELERADKRKAVVEASQAHRKLHDPGRVTTPEKGAAWASGGAMPAPLYHATLAGSAIMAWGLKAREDLRRSDGGRVESLGGGPDNTVSTTPDPNGARKIAAVFAAIAEAEENPEAVKSWLDKNWLPLVPPGYEAMLKEIEYADARPDPFLGVKARFNIISQIAGYAHPHVLVPAILAKPRVGELGDIGVVTVYAHVDAVMDDRGRVSAGPGAEMVQGESHLRVVRPNDVGEVDHGDLLHRSHAHLKTAHIAIASDNKAEQGEVRVAPEDATSVGFEPVTDWRAILSGKQVALAKSSSLAAAMGSLALLVPQDLSGVYSTIDDGWATRRYARMLTRRADLNYEAYRDAMGGLTRDGQPMAARLLDLPEQARDAWLRHSGDEPVFDANGVWIPLPDEEGELRWGEMAKGAHHKYIARFPTGNPKRPWRYVYRYVHRATRLTTFDGEGKSHSRAVHSATLHDKPSRLLDSNQPIVVGMSFSDGVIGKHSGHWVVSGISKNEDYPSLSGVVVKHDVTGEERFFHDRFDLGDFVDFLHTEGLAAESSRRAAVIARNQDEVFDQMVGLAKSNATKDELQQLSKASYRLARLGGDKPLALARYFKVSVEPPKGWAKARAELEQLRSDLSVFCLDGSVRDYEHAAALMFVPDALRKWIRFRVLQDWVDSHVDSLDAHDFLRRLMNEHQLTGDESSDAVEAAVKKTLMVMYKDGSTSMRPSDVKAMSGWDAASRMLGDRDGYGMTDDGRVRRAKIKMALDDAFSARKIAAPTIRYGLPDRDEVVQKALKVGDRMTPSSWEPVTPEMLSDPHDNVQGLNPLTYMGSGVLMPFSVAIGRMAHASGRHEFLAKHRERMDAVRSVVAEVHSVCAPLLEAHSAQLAQDVYRDGGELRVVVRPVKAASPAEVVLPLLSKALGIPEDAAHRNAPRLISHGESDTVTISGPGSDVRGVTDDDRADAAPLFASVHPDVLPLVGVAHLPEAGRSYCNGNTVALHSNATRVTLWHEVGHAIEHLSPEISQAMRTYLLERSKGSQKTPLSRYGGYREDEHTYPDQWSNPYCGKWYDYLSTEILSMGLQNYLHDPVKFYRDDPEHFMLTAAAISGKFTRRDSNAGGPA